jgi:hypothetical protein
VKFTVPLVHGNDLDGDLVAHMHVFHGFSHTVVPYLLCPVLSLRSMKIE